MEKINLSNASSFGENYADVAANGCNLGEENCDNEKGLHLF